jgi:hypothetical protein
VSSQSLSPNSQSFNRTGSLRAHHSAGGSPLAPGGELSSGLYDSAGASKVRLKNVHTGEFIEVDQRLARVQRLRSRLAAWCDYSRHGLLKGCVMKMVTLTYAELKGPDGRPVGAWRPDHISAFIGRVRRELGDALRAYAWVAELQQRGEVHYHCLLVMRKDAWLSTPDKSGLWPHGSTRVEVARSPAYVMKYAQKVRHDMAFPRGLRLYGVWVAKEWRGELYDRILREKALPAWLRPMSRESETWPRRVSGGGWSVVMAGIAAVAVAPWVMVAYVPLM